MHLYNTLTRKKEEFAPLEANKVKMYLCGPTVYDLGHLGHARSALAFDIIRKYLQFKGFKVTFVSNYTDIDDKMINRANEKNISVKELADKIIPEYKKDYAELNITDPDFQPKATEFINTIIKIIQGLIDKNIAYTLEDGVYYDISQFPSYGKLSGQNLEELKAGARVEVDDKKKNPHDFVLWKKAKPGEPKWASPWGEGRPGWHIECSAMNYELLGETIDIHGGGADLIFPHHEDEIAQSEGFTGKQFVKYWLHNGFIQINKEKMSKSLGNFTTIRDALKTYDGRTIRFFLIFTHYRSPIDFTDNSLIQAKNTLQRLDDFINNLKNYAGNEEKKVSTKILEQTKIKFIEAMDNDFETPQALGAIFEMIKEINILITANKLSQKDKENILNLLNDFNRILDIMPKEKSLPAEIQELINLRNQARKEKDWKKSDELREQIKTKGFIVEDTKDGKTIWKKIN